MNNNDEYEGFLGNNGEPGKHLSDRMDYTFIFLAVVAATLVIAAAAGLL